MKLNPIFSGLIINILGYMIISISIGFLFRFIVKPGWSETNFENSLIIRYLLFANSIIIAFITGYIGTLLSKSKLRYNIISLCVVCVFVGLFRTRITHIYLAIIELIVVIPFCIVGIYLANKISNNTAATEERQEILKD